MTAFKHHALRELTDQQVRFAPPARRTEQVAKAGKLLAEIDSARVYPYQFVCFRLTDYRSDAYGDLLVPGDELKHDLGLFITKVERSLPPLPVELAAEPMLTLDEVSKQFNVSTKTVSRWRLQGLAARRVIRGGRKQLGFPASSVAAFASAHTEQVNRGARFSHLTDAEKDDIVVSARALAAAGGTLTDVSKRIAGKLGRSAEAVRYTIKNFDRDHPAAAVFPATTGPLDAAAKQQIIAAVEAGKKEDISMDLIAKRFGRTRSSMYRVVNEVRAERLVREPVDYIYNAEFDDSSKHAEILGPMPHEDEFFDKVRGMKAPKDVEAHMAYLYGRPLLSREQEAHLFRKMNFLKHQMHQLQERVDPARARVQDLHAVEQLHDRVKTVRDLLIECNQRLVHSLATKHLQPTQNLDELKSDANVSLMRAVEKFDYGRGFKFSTYATWAVMKNFARSIPDENTRKMRYMTGHDDLFDGKADVRSDEGKSWPRRTPPRARCTGFWTTSTRGRGR